MKLITVKSKEHREAKAWYVKYPLDAYALGPFRYPDPVTADVVVEQAKNQFGERPTEVWPYGSADEVPEYEYELDVPDER